MYVGIITVLSLIQLISAQSCISSQHSKTPVGHSADNELLKEIKEQLQREQKMNENILQLIKTTEKNLQELIKKQRIELEKSLEKLKTEISTKPPLGTQNPDEACTVPCSQFKDICASISNETTIPGPTHTGQTIAKPNTIPYDSCQNAVLTTNKSGVYHIRQPEYAIDIKVYCLKSKNETIDPFDRSAWTIIQRRHNAKQDFFKNWHEYAEGFGDPSGDYFIGLKSLHKLTEMNRHALWIQLEDWTGAKRFEKYLNFAIGSESEYFYLRSVGDYGGDAGDSLSSNLDNKWSTYDKDHDLDGGNCAQEFKGAWWYVSCTESNLMGQYQKESSRSYGIFWARWHGYTYSYKYVHMAIRPFKGWE